MSWDLVFWKGPTTDLPPDVWTALADERDVKFIQPLRVQDIRRAFEEEYGADIAIAPDDSQTTFMGRGWEGALADGDSYFYVTCGWGLVHDDEWITRLVRAGLRAGCTVYDPQSGQWWDPPAPDWTPESFSVWDELRGLPDES